MHHITFRSQRGIGGVAVVEEMCFFEDVSLKLTCSDAREGRRWSFISAAQLKFQIPKIFQNVNCPQGINHSRFH